MDQFLKISASCNNESFICHDRCIGKEQVCNGVRDCLEGEDETHCCEFR